MSWQKGDVIGYAAFLLAAFLGFMMYAKSAWRHVWLFVAIGILAVTTCIIFTPDVRGLLNQDTLADLRADEAKTAEHLTDLKKKGPPYFYRITEGCPDIWVNVDGQRMLVVGGQSIKDPSMIPIEPLGSSIPEDKDHFYDGEKVVSVNSDDGKDVAAANCFPPVSMRVAASRRIARVGEPVHFVAFASGGDDYYSYVWGDEKGRQIANRSRFDHAFKTAGIKTVRGTVFSNGTSHSETASVLVRP